MYKYSITYAIIYVIYVNIKTRVLSQKTKYHPNTYF